MIRHQLRLVVEFCRTLWLAITALSWSQRHVDADAVSALGEEIGSCDTCELPEYICKHHQAQIAEMAQTPALEPATDGDANSTGDDE